MKLIMAVVNDDDAFKLMDTLNDNGYSVTKLASTGGFLKSGNTTLICGVEEEKLEDAVALIEAGCKSRKKYVPANMAYNVAKDVVDFPPLEITVGGATIFVMNVEQMRKV